MINLKKKLATVFDRIILKLCTNTKNSTYRPLALEVLREEVQVVICIVVALELKTILKKTLKYFFNEYTNNLITDKILKIVIIASKSKIISTLNLLSPSIPNKLDKKNNWLLQEIQIEDYTMSIFLLKQLKLTKNCTKKSKLNQLFISLSENLIIKISNYIVCELFSSGKLSKKNCLKFYAIDFFIFSYNLMSLRFYLYWRLYVESFYLNVKRFSIHKHKIILCTKNGFGIKKFHNKEISNEISSPKTFNLIIKCLSCMNYIHNKQKSSSFK